MAVALSVLGTLAVAVAVLSPPPSHQGPSTIAEAIGAAPDATMDERRVLAVAMRTRACMAALHGDGAGQAGCHGRALDAVHGLRDRALEPLRERLDGLRMSIEQDPAIPALDAGWDACVRMERSFTERAAAVRSDPPLVAEVAKEERRVASGIARCKATYTAGMAVIAAPYEARFVATYRSLLARIGLRIRSTEAAYPLSRPPTPWPRPAATAR